MNLQTKSLSVIFNPSLSISASNSLAHFSPHSLALFSVYLYGALTFYLLSSPTALRPLCKPIFSSFSLLFISFHPFILASLCRGCRDSVKRIINCTPATVIYPLHCLQTSLCSITFMFVCASVLVCALAIDRLLFFPRYIAQTFLPLYVTRVYEQWYIYTCSNKVGYLCDVLRTFNKVLSTESLNIPSSLQATAWVRSIDLQTTCDDHNEL